MAVINHVVLSVRLTYTRTLSIKFLQDSVKRLVFVQTTFEKGEKILECQ